MREIPKNLIAAYNWIDSAREWPSALSDVNYAAEAYQNYAEHHDDGEVTVDLLESAMEWYRRENTGGAK